MLIQKLRERMGKAPGESGFTLVELLVVMLILGILAAIAIPAFFNQREKAKDADAKSMARTAATAIETYATDNGGTYVGANAAGLEGLESTIDTGAGDDPRLTTVDTLSQNTYRVGVESGTPVQRTFYISRQAGGNLQLTCSVAAGADRGGCPTGGNWGN